MKPQPKSKPQPKQNLAVNKAIKTPPPPLSPQDLEIFSSGASSTERVSDMSMIPLAALLRVGAIYSEGAEKHGLYNYHKGIAFGDTKWTRDRVNHVIRHLYAYINNAERGPLSDSYLPDEDHLAKAVWGIFTLMEVEDMTPRLISHTFLSQELLEGVVGV